MDIKSNVIKFLDEIPRHVEVVAAAKTRNADEIRQAVAGGVRIIGENYVQEASTVFPEIGREARWHFIGHLQKNKVKKAVGIFDMIETVDSVPLAEEINKRSGSIGKDMPVLIEINSGREPNKYGVLPEDVLEMVRTVATLPHIRLLGLMTMGPLSGDPEEARPFFRITRELFEEVKTQAIKGADMRYLSMGMTNSYKIAIEEGANMIRIGTKIFGERTCNVR